MSAHTAATHRSLSRARHPIGRALSVTTVIAGLWLMTATSSGFAVGVVLLVVGLVGVIVVEYLHVRARRVND